MTGVQSPGGDDGHSDECDAVGGDELGVVRKAGFGTAILKSRNGRDGPWRKCFSTVYEIEDFHIHTSILLDRIVGIYEPYFGEKNAVVSGNHEAFLKNLKHRPDINYLPATLITGAKWLQDNVDWYRNRLIIHPAG